MRLPEKAIRDATRKIPKGALWPGTRSLRPARGRSPEGRYGMTLRIWSLVALTVAALSLGPSFAHVLEAPPRLTVWAPELWREATVFNGQFRLFATVGAPLDLGATLVTALLAYRLRDAPGRFRFALAGAVLFGLGLAAWFARVAPANAVLARGDPDRSRPISRRSAIAGRRATWRSPPSSSSVSWPPPSRSLRPDGVRISLDAAAGQGTD